jgi:hypothetical protein
MKDLSKTISELRGAAEHLLKTGGEMEAIKRNVTKILANVKMLELNISDVNEIVHGS